MSKYYFLELYDETCYSLEDTKGLIKELNLKEKEVYRAKLITDIDFMYCVVAGDIGEKGLCGKDCKWYEARNGKNGNCKFNRGVYEPFDKILIKV